MRERKVGGKKWMRCVEECGREGRKEGTKDGRGKWVGKSSSLYIFKVTRRSKARKDGPGGWKWAVIGGRGGRRVGGCVYTWVVR